MSRIKGKPKQKPSTTLGILDMPFDRKDKAVVVLFAAGFEMWEIAALFRRSTFSVVQTIRKRL